jgi:sec-independent protein translocase protein TatB
MFDFAWSELALIAVVALIFIGPKDLPKVMRMAAGMARKARAMLSEVQGGVDRLVREAELQDVRDQVSQALRVKNDLTGFADPTRVIKSAIKDAASPSTSGPSSPAPRPATQATESPTR